MANGRELILPGAREEAAQRLNRIKGLIIEEAVTALRCWVRSLRSKRLCGESAN
jgi:hypothetical protein